MSSLDKDTLLASLRDLHEPPAPETAWPWLIAAIVLGIGLLVVLWFNRPRKKTSIPTQQINAAREEPPAQALVRLARLLRSHVLKNQASFDAGVQGDAWLQALDAQFNTAFFTTGYGRVFGDDLYQQQSATTDITTLCDKLQKLFDANPSKASA